jgi:hypothetical protein
LFFLFLPAKMEEGKKVRKRNYFECVHDFLFPFSAPDFPRILIFPYFLLLISTEPKPNFTGQKMEKEKKGKNEEKGFLFIFLCACLPSYLDLRDYLPILFPVVVFLKGIHFLPTVSEPLLSLY